MELSSFEIETNINYTEYGDKATVYTCDQKLIKRLLGLAERFPDDFKVTSSTELSTTFEVSKKLVRIRNPYVLVNYNDKQRRSRNMNKHRYNK